MRRIICPVPYMNEVLEKVKEFTADAHDGQKRKYTPEPYIVHPVRVMDLCREYSSSLPVLSAALLHDVLEDTKISKEDLVKFLRSVMSEVDADETLGLVVELTDVYTKSKYPRWNREKRKRKEAERIEQTSADAQSIKYADIIDNCKEIAQYDEEFGPQFLCECRMLLRRMKKGNPQLYRQASQVVEQGLAEARALHRKKEISRNGF